MRFKVPQDVQREDQILWFITLRQLIMLMIGFGISYMLFINLKKEYELSTIEMILIWIPAAISAAFAFLKIKGIRLPQFFLLLIEQIFFRRTHRFWIAGAGEPFASLTMSVHFSSGKKKEDDMPEKIFNEKKAEELAQFLDNEKGDYQKKKEQQQKIL